MLTHLGCLFFKLAVLCDCSMCVHPEVLSVCRLHATAGIRV
uniref:Uncharacterized protein n=1 Tax=Setaria viridis TaxID=4556 RepID=A0A4U6THA0_SETVI|nr:hypothetical protein SEVIR_8G198450v2 [Setaria viridis]